MNKKSIVAIILAVTVCLSAGFIYSKNNSSKPKDVISSSEIEEIKDIQESLSNNTVEENVVELKDADFSFKAEDGFEELEFGTPWKVSPKGDMHLAIEGRGMDAIEEGLGILCLKKEDGVKFLFVDNDSLGISPKYVEWLDNDTFLVYMVNSYGRVFSGGSLYIVNVDDMVPKLMYIAKENEEISEATQIDADIINMKILEYKNETKVSVEKNIKIK